MTLSGLLSQHPCSLVASVVGPIARLVNSTFLVAGETWAWVLLKGIYHTYRL